MAMKIVILEDNADRREAMRECLQDRFYHFEAVFFDEPAALVEYLRAHLPETAVISLDHDLELRPDHEGRLIDPGTNDI